MGIAVVTYSGLRQMDESEIIYKELFDEDNEVIEKFPENGFTFCKNKHFPHAAQDIPDDAVYSSESSTSFHAGSYSGYGEWRNWLAKIVGWESVNVAWEKGEYGQPFMELLKFSDCDGVLGTEVCKKLAKDFLDYEKEAMQSSNDYHTELYQKWKSLFVLASNNGAISFH